MEVYIFVLSQALFDVLLFSALAHIQNIGRTKIIQTIAQIRSVFTGHINL